MLYYILIVCNIYSIRVEDNERLGYSMILHVTVTNCYTYHSQSHINHILYRKILE